MGIAQGLGDAEVAELAAHSGEVLNRESPAPLLLICEHAGRVVPPPWRSLGVADAILDSHFGSDIGADALVRAIASRFHLPAVLARYSRLFLDYNRLPTEWDCTRPDAGGIPIPGNVDVSGEERGLREAIARRPLEAMIEDALAGRKAAISIHTFTPVFYGFQRPWEVGVLWRDDDRLARSLLRSLGNHCPRSRLGDNEPYDLRGVDAFTLKRHAHARGLPGVALEIRNDLLGDASAIDRMATSVGSAIAEGVADCL
jgi:predicted N-formylglutamate amidohydrolase